MYEYCDLASGDEKLIEEGYDVGLYLKRHNNTYTLTAVCSNGYAEKDINYCPMCGRDLRDEK